MDNTGEGLALYSSVRAEDGTYSNPVTLYKDDNMLGKMFTPVLGEDGEWDITMTAGSKDDPEKTSLLYLHTTSAPKIELDCILISPCEQDKNVQPYSFVVTNNSEERIDTFTIEVETEGGKLTEKTIDKTILPGESVYMEDTIDMSGLSGEQTVSAKVRTPGQEDLTDTVQETSVSLEDVSLTVEKQVYNDHIDFVATVKNEGHKAAEGNLVMYSEAKGGTALDTKSYGQLQPGKTKTIVFTRNNSDVVLQKDGSTSFRIEATSNSQEYDEGNNYYYGVIYKREVGAESSNIPSTEKKEETGKSKKSGSKDSIIPVSSIKLSGISKKIAAGKKIQLTANVLPANATNKGLTWKSSNTKIATVNQSGKVTIKKKTGGKSVTITAAAKDGSGVKGTWTIKSMKGVVKSVKIKGAKPVKAGKKLKLKATVKASKGANKKLKWTSGNTKYAAVTQKGVVKTKKAGKGKKVKITAMATDGSGKKKSVNIKIK
jgi:uncharacterized protein YjdB